MPPLELRVRVCRRSRDGSATHRDRAGLRLRNDPLRPDGRVWQWVVDVDAELPALNDVLATCHDFLVDDDCGRGVGVVKGVIMDPDPPCPARLLLLQCWGGQRTTVAVDEVIELVPNGCRLVISCRADHVPQSTRRNDDRVSLAAWAVAAMRSLVARWRGAGPGDQTAGKTGDPPASRFD